jgi:hypothetical protein
VDRTRGDDVTHEGAVTRVRDAHGYDADYAARCACGWTSGELRDRPSAAMPDLYAHIADSPTTTERAE